MLSSDEKYRLMQDHKGEFHYVTAVVMKCAACLLLIAGIAAIGIATDAEPGDGAGQRLAQHKERTSIVDARERLEERRTQFDLLQARRRELAGAAFSGGIARSATPEPDTDEVASLSHGKY